jgi:hypothetical protein
MSGWDEWGGMGRMSGWDETKPLVLHNTPRPAVSARTLGAQPWTQSNLDTPRPIPDRIATAPPWLPGLHPNNLRRIYKDA